MKGRIEVGDLQRIRKGGLRRSHAGEIVGLVQRCERVEVLKTGKLLLIEHDGFAKIDAAVHDPVTDRLDRDLFERPFKKAKNDGKRRCVIGCLCLA